MEFCLRSLLFTVVWSTCCFVKTTVGRGNGAPLPKGVNILADAIETKHGGYNISWDVQPANSVLRVQPKILVAGNDSWGESHGVTHPEAKYWECLPRIHPVGVQEAVITIFFRKSFIPYTHRIRTLSSPSPLSKSK